MKIRVTQEDINNGKPNDPSRCPVALACRKLTEGNISVGYIFITYYLSGKLVRRIVPKGVIGFIVNFDDGKPVGPFEFELED